MFKKCLITASVMAISAWAAPASALTFCPSGTGVGCVAFNVLDQSPGNAIAGAFAGTQANGPDFNVLYQANLDSTQNGGANTFSNGSGGNFFTFVLGYQETITFNNVNPATGNGVIQFGYSTDNDPTISNNPTDPNFFYMYKVPVLASDLAGTGFVPGTAPILSGHTVPLDYSSNYGLTGLASPDPIECGPANVAPPGCLDQGGLAGLPGNGLNNYPGVATLSGSGSVKLKIVIDSFNPAYFPDFPVGASIILDTTASTDFPYEDIDPSALFNTTGINPLTVTPGVSSVGAVNGLTGPNTVFETDAKASVVAPTAVPEPATLTLLGLGLVAGARRRKKANKK